MKKTLSSLALLASLAISAQQLKIQEPSPRQTIKQDFALSSIEINYSRPGVKGRQIFGGLVPFGKVWRTGANEATTITFADDVIINGQDIKAGKYGLLTIPGKDQWSIIISRQLDVTNPKAYKESENVLKMEVTPVKQAQKTETFQIDISDVTTNSCSVNLTWENTKVSFTVSRNIDAKIMADIERAMYADNRPYFTAAVYYVENDKDLNKALEWFEKSEQAYGKAFWISYQKAICLEKLGKKKEAINTAEEGMKLAEKAGNSDYVYLNQKILERLRK